jgi:multiple sugar transport system permease protein
LNDQHLALPISALIGVWVALAFNIITVLAALQDIPRDLYEVADLEGVTFWQRMRFVTLPCLVPSLFMLLTISIINSFRKLYDDRRIDERRSRYILDGAFPADIQRCVSLSKIFHRFCGRGTLHAFYCIGQPFGCPLEGEMGDEMNRKRPVFTAVMWLLGLCMIYPFVMMVSIGFRPAGLAYEPLFAPVKPILDNYGKVLFHKNFGDWYRNTILTVCITIVLRLLVTLPAAYAFSRLRFRGSRFVMAALMATLMVPGETTMVPRYLFFRQLHLLDSMWVIILPEISEVFYLMLMTEFFRSIPEDFSEAAKIDGAGHGTILLCLFLPLSGPSVATTVLFSFINIWNNFLDPYLFISTVSHQLITPALQYFQERGGANIPMQLAGATFAVVPVVFLFIFTQRYFVAGVSSSGIKG